jgi:LysR family transcriptional regulator for bpeEF and oprC
MSSSVRLLIAFAEAAQQRSFARAARELGLSPSAVVKSVARLEQGLGVRLFQRTTRQIQLTQAGEALFQRCRRVLAELADLEQAAAAASGSVSGVLRLDLPITYGKQVIVPVLARLTREHPGLALDLRFSDAFVDVVQAGLDAVVRIGDTRDSRLIARVFDHERLGVFAAPAYLSERGTPKSVVTLGRHEWLRFRLPSSGRRRPIELGVRGKRVELEPGGKFTLDDGEALIAAARSGLGLLQAPRYMADQALARGELVEVLERFEPRPLPIAIVFASRRDVPARLRVLIEALGELHR